MFLLFRQYENGMITFETMLSGMIYKETTSQYSFHTQKATRLLKKVGGLSMCRIKQMVEYMVQDLVEILTDARVIEYDEAMCIVYTSSIYEKLIDPETGLYRESPWYVYGLLQDELNFGHIVQAEL